MLASICVQIDPKAAIASLRSLELCPSTCCTNPQICAIAFTSGNHNKQIYHSKYPMAVGSEAMGSSLTVYDYVKTAAKKTPGLKTIAQQLGERFKAIKSKPVKAAVDS